MTVSAYMQTDSVINLRKITAAAESAPGRQRFAHSPNSQHAAANRAICWALTPNKSPHTPHTHTRTAQRQAQPRHASGRHSKTRRRWRRLRHTHPQPCTHARTHVRAHTNTVHGGAPTPRASAIRRGQASRFLARARARRPTCRLRGQHSARGRTSTPRRWRPSSRASRWRWR